MSQKIYFKQPNEYSQNSPECRISTLEGPPPPKKITPSVLNYFLLFTSSVKSY
jgi:hypothetical protein